MIDRDDVLHVARLARLRLREDEVQQMASELSKVLAHVERMSELDLEGVEPTSHVVRLENVLREDVPSESLSPDAAVGPAPDVNDEQFRVPSPQAGGEEA